jgi:hypothetical protein
LLSLYLLALKLNVELDGLDPLNEGFSNLIVTLFATGWRDLKILGIPTPSPINSDNVVTIGIKK